MLHLVNFWDKNLIFCIWRPYMQRQLDLSGWVFFVGHPTALGCTGLSWSATWLYWALLDFTELYSAAQGCNDTVRWAGRSRWSRVRGLIKRLERSKFMYFLLPSEDQNWFQRLTDWSKKTLVLPIPVKIFRDVFYDTVLSWKYSSVPQTKAGSRHCLIARWELANWRR